VREKAPSNYVQYWNRYASNYKPTEDRPWPGDEWAGPSHWANVFQNLFLSHLPSDTATAIEIGPGSGKYTLKFLEAFPGSKVIAADISPAYLEVLRERCAAEIQTGRLVPGLIEDHQSIDQLAAANGILPGTLDVMFSIDAMVHVDLQHLIAYWLSASRLLKPGGSLIMTVADATTDIGFAKLVQQAPSEFALLKQQTSKFEWMSPDLVKSVLGRLGFATRAVPDPKDHHFIATKRQAPADDPQTVGDKTLRDVWVDVDDGTWKARHVVPYLARYPFWACVAKEGYRLRLLMNSEPVGPLVRALAADADNTDGVARVDLAKSNFLFLERMEEVLKSGRDPLSTESVSYYRMRADKYERRIARGENLGFTPMGRAYWFSLLCGLVELRDTGRFTADNTYYKFWKRGIEVGDIDPGLAIQLPTEEMRLARLSERMEAMLKGLQSRTMSFDRPIAYNPLPDNEAFRDPSIYKTIHVDGEDLFVPDLDGHHRLFFAALLGATTIDMQLVWSPEILRTSRVTKIVSQYEKMIEDYLTRTPHAPA
jgi:SAM-dependent methyltransferase